MDVTLLQALGRTWWLVLLRGLAAIVFGILAWTWPGVTLITLVLFWGAYALVDGVAALIGGWQAKDSGKPMWQIVLIGVIGIAAGIFTFVQPGVTAVALLILIAAWAIVQGIFEIAAAIRLRKEIKNEWLLILSGVLVRGVRNPDDREPRGRRDGRAVAHRRVLGGLRGPARLPRVQAEEARRSARRGRRLKRGPRAGPPNEVVVLGGTRARRSLSASACTSTGRRNRSCPASTGI